MLEIFRVFSNQFANQHRIPQQQEEPDHVEKFAEMKSHG